MGWAARCAPLALPANQWSTPMAQSNDLSFCLTALEQDSTLIAVIELGLRSWLVAGLIPGASRQPLKKLDPRALDRWRDEAVKAGRPIKRLVVAFEAGRDGFWLARWLRAREIEAYVIHASSIPVPREHRRAKTDRLDTQLLMRAFLGWLRGERKHCSMVAIPTLAEEDAKRPSREHEKLGGERSRLVNKLKAAMIRLGIRGFNVKLGQAAERLEDRLMGRPAFTASSRQRSSARKTSCASGSSFFRGCREAPGISPATSQLRSPSSITAISVLSCSRAVRQKLRSFDCAMGVLHWFAGSANGAHLAAHPIASSPALREKEGAGHASQKVISLAHRIKRRRRHRREELHERRSPRLCAGPDRRRSRSRVSPRVLAHHAAAPRLLHPGLRRSLECRLRQAAILRRSRLQRGCL